MANAAAAAILMAEKEPPSVFFGVFPLNDAFVLEDHFFRSGPEFRLCSPEYRGSASVFKKNEESKCGIRNYQHKDIGLMDKMSGNFIIEDATDVSPQEYLDIMYGEGTVILAGVGGIKGGRDRDTLVLFYKIKN